jgi:hypothetical protein
VGIGGFRKGRRQPAGLPVCQGSREDIVFLLVRQMAGLAAAGGETD